MAKTPRSEVFIGNEVRAVIDYRNTEKQEALPVDRALVKPEVQVTGNEEEQARLKQLAAVVDLAKKSKKATGDNSSIPKNLKGHVELDPESAGIHHIPFHTGAPRPKPTVDDIMDLLPE